MVLSTRRLTSDPLVQFHSRLNGWLVRSLHPLSPYEENGSDEADMERSEAMTEETPLNSGETNATQERKTQTFPLSPEDGICSHAARFSTRAALCVGHFGSAVTILDKRRCDAVDVLPVATGGAPADGVA